METFAMYLVRSVSWLSGFALVYFLFLKNERFFEHNRIFLISGILAALVLPFINFTYRVMLPVVRVPRRKMLLPLLPGVFL